MSLLGVPCVRAWTIATRAVAVCFASAVIHWPISPPWNSPCSLLVCHPRKKAVMIYLAVVIGTIPSTTTEYRYRGKRTVEFYGPFCCQYCCLSVKKILTQVC